MKTTWFAVFLGMSSFLFGVMDSDPFLQITDPSGPESYLPEELTTPFTLKGACSTDVKSITIFWTNERQIYVDEAWQNVIQGDNLGYTLKKFRPGDTFFLYRLHSSLNNLAEGTNTYTIVAKLKNGKEIRSSCKLYYMRHMGERAKPVIYLYPLTKRIVSVKVQPKEGLSITIPDYGQGWTVTAEPSGRIVNQGDGKEYPYLFWESPDSNSPWEPREGFSSSRAGLEDFFKAKLEFLGLNTREIQDFLEFWIPNLQAYPWYQIAFTPQSVLDMEAPLTVYPKPDSVIRVYFQYRGTLGEQRLPPQDLNKGLRTGFTVVEWGGRKE